MIDPDIPEPEPQPLSREQWVAIGQLVFVIISFLAGIISTLGAARTLAPKPRAILIVTVLVIAVVAIVATVWRSIRALREP